jgi:hypothetical protein
MHRAQLQIGHSDRLQVDVTEETKCLSFRKGENPSFLKVYAGCSIDRLHTYTGCSIDRSHTYVSCNIYRSCTYWYLLVHDDYWYRLITGYWYRLVTGCWHRLVQVYSGISHSDSVAVVSSFLTLIFQGGWMGKGKGVVASFWLVPENQGVGASFRLEPEN